MTTYSLSTYHDVARQLDQLESWLVGFGIQVGPTRVGYYRRRIDALITAHAAGSIAERFSQEDVRTFVLSFQEIQELEFIRQHLSNEPNACLPEKLREIVGGPVLSSGEVSSGNSNHARNILFELTIAATLVTSGYHLLPAGTCDLCTSFEGRRVMIECKRPQSNKKVARSVKDAMGQLRRHLGSEPKDSIGILALSVSKIISEGNYVIQAPTKEWIRSELLASLDRFLYMHRLSWNQNIPHGMVAVVLHAGATGIANDKGQLYTGKQYSVCAVERIPAQDVMLAKRFYDQFASGSIEATEG